MEKRSGEFTTSLYVAAENGHSEYIKLVHEKGVDPKRSLVNLTCCEEIPSFELFLEKGADPNLEKKSGEFTTPLLIATQN